MLLSSKEGDAKLELCPDPNEHGGLNSRVHTAPKKFNRQKMHSTFGEVATPAQMKEAGWSSAKKSKK